MIRVIHERSKQQMMSTNLLRYWNISNGRLWDRNVTSKEINKYNNGKAKEVWKHTVYKATEWSFVIVYWPSFFCHVMQTVDGTDGYCTYATFRWHTSTSAPLAHGHLRTKPNWTFQSVDWTHRKWIMNKPFILSKSEQKMLQKSIWT